MTNEKIFELLVGFLLVIGTAMGFLAVAGIVGLVRIP
jgi:hypothetical protein